MTAPWAGMTATGWVALAGALALAGGAGPAGGRALGLRTEGRLAGSAPNASPGHRFALPAGAAVALLVALVALAAVFGGTPAGVAAAAVARAGWVAGRDAVRRRRDAAASAQLAAAVGTLVAELEAGARPAAALDAAAAGAPLHAAVLGAAASRAAAGLDAAEPLVEGEATRGLGHAWRLAAAAGAAPAAVLARVAGDLAAGTAQRRAVTVALAGPRSSAVVLSGLPAVGLVLGTGMGAHPIAFLLDSRAGSIVGCVGVLLDVAGLAWIRAILARAARG